MKLFIWHNCTGLDQYSVFAETQTEAEGFLREHMRTKCGEQIGNYLFKHCKEQFSYSLVVRDVKPGVVSLSDE
jgi:hypothetical protein